MATNYTNPTPVSAPLSQVGPNIAPFQVDVSKLVASFAGFVLNDTLQLVQIPNYCAVTDILIYMPAMDSSTGFVWQLGDNAADGTHGAAGAGGFATALTLGQSATAGSLRAYGTGWVAGTIPWLYSMPVATIPSGGLWLTMKVTTAPTGTPSTTGIIRGYMAFTFGIYAETAGRTGSVTSN